MLGLENTTSMTTATWCCTHRRARGPKWIFIAVPGEKSVKNRIHLDFKPDDQQAEVARLVGLGAKQVDIGQSGDESWVVLADPEGNEFCILAARRLTLAPRRECGNCSSTRCVEWHTRTVARN